MRKTCALLLGLAAFAPAFSQQTTANDEAQIALRHCGKPLKDVPKDSGSGMRPERHLEYSGHTFVFQETDGGWKLTGAVGYSDVTGTNEVFDRDAAMAGFPCLRRLAVHR